MATQYMYSPQMNYARYPSSHTPLQHPQNGNGFKNGGFAFRKRFERVDWRKMASIDVEQISRTLDFNALQENIMNITFCNIETELDVRSVDPNFLKLFKLAQLTIEYLLYSQEYLAGLCTSMEEKTKKTEQDEDGLKKELEAVKKELNEVKRESHKRKKLLIAQQQLMHAGAGSYNKCPFCPKAFLNGSFLQAHIARRHGSGSGSGSAVSSGAVSGEPSKGGSMDHGVGSSGANNAQVSEILERLQAKEAQLEEDRKALASLKRKEDQIMPMVAGRIEAATEQQAQLHKQEIEEVKEVFMKEMREVNEKYLASERALVELEQRYGVKRSYLGTTLQDDVENEKEMLQQQRAEVAALREELQKQMDTVEDKVQDTIKAQEKRRHHHRERAKKSRGREHRSAVEDEVIPLDVKQEQAEVLMQSAEKEAKERGISMYPSDEDEASFGIASGTSSLRTPRTLHGNSTLGSTLGATGNSSLNLRTSQFLEQLRQNPTLGIMREQLAELLSEKVEKCGVPRGAPGIDDTMLNNKLAMQRTQRQTCLKRYPNFMELRERFNREAHDKAVNVLRQRRKQSPRPFGAGPSPRSQTGRSPRPLSAMQEPRSASASGRPGMTAGRGSAQNTPRSSSAPSPRPRVQATPKAQPQPQPRASPQKTPLSTGSTTEWTSTQWDSEEDSEDEEDISGIKPFSPAPNTRLIQSGPRPSPSSRPSPSPRPSPRHQPKATLIQSRPLHGGDDDIEDILGSDREDSVHARTQPVRMQSPASRLSSSAPQPRGQNVAHLARSIENQLGSRGQGKPVGGVDTMSSAGTRKNQAYLEDFDDASDWDDTEEPARPPPRGGEKRVRTSTDVSSNTFGTSQWGGSTSKGASTVKPDAKRSTSRSSFVSVTDLSSDEDMNVDNI